MLTVIDVAVTPGAALLATAALAPPEVGLPPPVTDFEPEDPHAEATNDKHTALTITDRRRNLTIETPPFFDLPGGLRAGQGQGDELPVLYRSTRPSSTTVIIRQSPVNRKEFFR
jgi:hypothetical protein